MILRLPDSTGQQLARFEESHCAHKIADYDPAVIENFLEFRGSLGAPVRHPIRSMPSGYQFSVESHRGSREQ